MKNIDRVFVRTILAALVIGFVYSEAATLRLSKEWWMKAVPPGPSQ